MATVAAESGVVIPMIVAATTGGGTIIACPASFQHHNFEIVTPTGVTAGAVTIETANDPAYAGTWAVVIPLGSVSNPLTVVAAASLLMNYTGLLNFVRARINTTISGGGGPSVTVNYYGSKSY